MNTQLSTDQLSNLFTLSNMREKKLHKAYALSKQSWQEFVVKADEIRDEVDRLKKDLQTVNEFSQDINRCQTVFDFKALANRRDWVIYDLDLQIYYLDVANSDVRDAAREMHATKMAWLKAREKKTLFHEQLNNSKRAKHKVLERREEREVEELAIGRGGLCG